LEAYKIGRKKEESNYEASIKWSSEAKELEWNMQDTLTEYKVLLNGKVLNFENGETKFSVEDAGLHYASLHLFPDNDTIIKETQFFIRSDKNRLLQDAKPESWEQSWSEPKVGKSVENNAIRIDGRVFEYGVGSHAPSRLVWNLNGAYKKFHSFIGLDDESACGNGAIWLVRGDGKELYRSRVLGSREIDSISVDISGVNKFELETLDNGDKDCDHSDWAGAWLE